MDKIYEKYMSMGITTMFKRIWLCIILFGFIFELPVVSVLTTRKIAAIVMVGHLIIYNKRSRIMWRKCKMTYILSPLYLWLIPFLFLLVNSAFVEKSSGMAYFEPYYFFYLIGYVPLFAFYSICVFENVKQFAQTYISIMVFQSCIVYLSAVNTSFRLFIYKSFYFGDSRFDRTIVFGTRIMGIGLVAAIGSITMACALFLLVYLVRNEQINSLSFAIQFIFVLGATALVGRTGFYIGCGLLLYVLFMMKGMCKKFSILVIGLLLVPVGVISLRERININVFNSIMSWIGEIFNADTRYNTITILNEMKIPELTWETFLGTGVQMGVSGSGARCYHDSGYVMTYFALGLLGATIFYWAVIWMYSRCLKIQNHSNKLFFLLMILVMLIIEIKEPFILKYVYSYVLLTMMLFVIKEDKVKEKIKWEHM